MASIIHNPYSSSHHSHPRSSSSSETRSSLPLASAACSRSSNSTTETMIRDILRSVEQGSTNANALPSLASVQALKEELRVGRGGDCNAQWSVDLARGFGHMVVHCMRTCGSIDRSKDAARSMGDTDATKHETVGALMLEVLATVMEDWEDHVLYAVLVQDEQSINHAKNGKFRTGEGRTEPSTNFWSCEHLLDVLTELSTQDDNGIRQSATLCLATAWRCLERLEDFATLTSGNTNGGYGGGNKGIPWWIASEGQAMNALGVTSLQSLCQIYGCSGSELDDKDDFCLQHTQQEVFSGDQEQVKVSLLTILVMLLRYQLLELSPSSVSTTLSASSSIGGCVIPEGTLSELISKLMREIQILNHSVLSPSSSKCTLPIAMLSMSLLSLLQRSLAMSENDSLFKGLNQTIQSTGLVENLVQFTFFSSISSELNGGAPSIGIPRWKTPSSNQLGNRYLQSFGFLLFSCWSVCDNAAWKVLVANLEPKLSGLIDSFWSNILEQDNLRLRDGGCHLEDQLPGILWLYLYMRQPARFRLSFVLERMYCDSEGPGSSLQSQFHDANPNTASKDRAPRKIMHSLFGILRLSSGTSYSSRLIVARLLRILLSDRRTVSSNDDMSRNFWSVIDESVVEGHFEAVLEHACTNDTDQPLLLALVDTMETLLEHSQCCNYLVDKLGAHNLEALIYLVKPNNIRYDFIQGLDDEAADTDTETPPLHNLSRMDETSICIEHEDIKKPRGLDHSVRLSVATSLAQMAYGSSVAPRDESTGLLVSRISVAVNDLLADFHATIERGGNAETDSHGTRSFTPSMDQIKRFTRLQYRVSTPENEDFLSTTLFTSMSLRKKTILKFKATQEETEQKLQMTLQRERKAQEEKMRLMQQLRTQSILFQREMSRTKMNLTQDTRQLVSMHASERSNAEERSNRLEKETEEARLELERVQSELQRALAELETTRSKTDQLNNTILRLQQEVKDEKVKAAEITNEAEAKREAIQSFEEKCNDMQNVIDERDDMISRAEDTNQNLQGNLEDLFADMCSLAQIYQHKEKQEESQKHKNSEAIEAINQKLVAERRSNEKLTSKIADIEEENEKLYRKLGKYKDRLELERKGRREEQEKRKEEDHRRKRNGPVSYLNSLHASTTFDNDASRSRSTRSSRDPTLSSQRPPSQYKTGDRSTHEKENNSGNYRSSTSQRRTKY